MQIRIKMVEVPARLLALLVLVSLLLACSSAGSGSPTTSDYESHRGDAAPDNDSQPTPATEAGASVDVDPAVPKNAEPHTGEQSSTEQELATERKTETDDIANGNDRSALEGVEREQHSAEPAADEGESSTDSGTARGEVDTASPAIDETDRHEQDSGRAVLPPSTPDSSPVALTDEDGTYDELIALFRDIVTPTDPTDRDNYLFERIDALDNWADGAPWAQIGALLDKQRNSTPNEPTLAVLWAWYLVHEEGIDSARTSEALATVESIAAADPNHIWAHLTLVLPHLRADMQAALERLDAVLERAPNFALAWRFKAELHLRRNEPNDAATAARRSIDLAPDRLFSEISVLGSVGELDAVRGLLERPELSPLARGYIYLVLGQIAIGDNDVDRAAPKLESAISALEHYGDDLTELTHREAQRAREIRTRAHIELASTAFNPETRELDWEVARRHLDAAIKAMPDARDPFVHYVVLLSRFRNEEVAISLFEPIATAIELRRSDVTGTLQLLEMFRGLLQMVPSERRPSPLAWRAVAVAAERMRHASVEQSLRNDDYAVWINMMRVCCPYSRHVQTRLAQPLEEGSLAEVSEEDLVEIVDWLVQLVDHRSFAVSAESQMWLGLIVRESGVRRDAVVGYAREVLGRPVGSDADLQKPNWASVLAVLGEEANAGYIVDAMQAILDAENLAVARRTFERMHFALRHLLDSDHLANFRFDRSPTLRSLTDLVDSWRDKLAD